MLAGGFALGAGVMGAGEAGGLIIVVCVDGLLHPLTVDAIAIANNICRARFILFSPECPTS